MALIKCPECGQSVSNSAGQCVHCGCKFTVCPECGKIYIGMAVICENCGYRFVKKETHVKAKNDTVENDSEIVDSNIVAAWKKRSPLDKTVLRAMHIFKYVAIVLVLGLIVLAIIKYIIWINSDAYEAFLKQEQTYKSILVCVIIGIIIDFLRESVDEINDIYSQLRCAAWIKNKKLDSIAIMEKSFLLKDTTRDNLMAIDDITNLKVSCQAAYYAENPNKKTSLYALIIIKVLFATLNVILFAVFCMQNIEESMRSALWETEFQFQWKMLIGFGIALVIYLVIEFPVSRAITNNYKTWLSQRSPSLYSSIN